MLLLIGILVLSIVYKSTINLWIEDLSCWIRDNPVFGPITLSGVYIVVTILSLPGFVLALAAGVAFHEAYKDTLCAVMIGGGSVFVGAWVGSNLAMLLARYLFRRHAIKLSHKYKLFRAIDQAMKDSGLKFTFLMRLCPIIPYNAYNYILGVTSVSLRDFALGGLGMVPGCLVYVFVGTTIGSIGDAVEGEYENSQAFLAFIIIGTISALLACIYITVVVRRYLKKNLEKVEPKVDTAPDEVDADQEVPSSRGPASNVYIETEAGISDNPPVIGSERKILSSSPARGNDIDDN